MDTKPIETYLKITDDGETFTVTRGEVSATYRYWGAAQRALTLTPLELGSDPYAISRHLPEGQTSHEERMLDWLEEHRRGWGTA